MAKIEPFEKFTLEYDDWFVQHKLLFETEAGALNKIFPDKIDRAVEIGIGTGRFAEKLNIPEGIDPSLAMRNIAQSRGLSVTDGTAEKTGLRGGSFDLVLMVTTVCFLDDLDQALIELGRILRYGGTIVIAFIDRSSPVGKQYQAIKDQDPFYKIARFYSTDEIIVSLIQNGFSDIKTVQTLFGPLDQIKEVQEPKDGYGEGSFVVVRAIK